MALQSQPGQPDQQQFVRLIAEILAAGLAFDVARRLVGDVLKPLRLAPAAISAATAFAMSRALVPQRVAPSMDPASGVLIKVGVEAQMPGPAEIAERDAASTWRAAYLVSAARRIDAAVAGGASPQSAADDERRFFNAHVGAQARRMEAARGVDAAAALYAPDTLLLGWNAALDTKTTPECRWADGKNFYANRRPVFGWPGAVHPYCRCVAGPANLNGRLLYLAPARLLGSH